MAWFLGRLASVSQLCQNFLSNQEWVSKHNLLKLNNALYIYVYYIHRHLYLFMAFVNVIYLQVILMYMIGFDQIKIENLLDSKIKQQKLCERKYSTCIWYTYVSVHRESCLPLSACVNIMNVLFSRRLLAEELQLDSDGDAVDVIGWMAIARQADDS